MSARFALALAVFVAGCGADGVIRKVGDLPAPPVGGGYLQIRCTPPDVDLYVDGAYRGQLVGYREGVVMLPEGRRRITLRKPRHYDYYQEVEIGVTTVRIETHLVPEVSEGQPPDLPTSHRE